MSNTKKCLSCRHFGSHFRNLTNEEPLTLIGGWCTAPAIAAQIKSAGYIVARGSEVDISTARDLCDKEADGIFVYYEPESPSSGAAFEAETRPVGSVFNPHGESRSEFERDRLGQTGYDNAKAMKAAA